LEIRIPSADWPKFTELAEDIKDWNILVHAPRGHTMRNGFLSIKVSLTPLFTIEQCRTYRRIGRGLNPRQKTRALNAICFHGHKAFMDLLFQRIPLAKIRSMFTDYFEEKWMTKENFKSMAFRIKSINVGSPMEPLEFGQQCECGESSN
jgi:hypothetical protein